MAERNYLKYNVVDKRYVLDSMYRCEDDFYSIRKVLLTDEQAQQFVDRIKSRYDDKGRGYSLSILEAEFDNFFHICSKCGTATIPNKYEKKYGDLCRDCYREIASEIRYKRRVAINERKRVERLAVYMKTEQGRIDAVGASQVYENIKIQMLKKGKTREQLAELLGVTKSYATSMFRENKSIKADRLFLIAEWLFVPFDVLVKLPRGEKFKKKNGVPINVYNNKVKSPTSK